MKPTRLTLTELGTATGLELQAADDKGRRRFVMSAYTGSPVSFAGNTMIIDLAGMDVSGKRKPILREHDRKQIAGYADEFSMSADGLVMHGYLSKSTAAGREVADLADEGFPWQASVGIDINDIARLAKDELATINGRELSGPAYIVTKSTLKESSFVPLGADSQTSAVVLSDGGDLSSLITEEITMAENAKPAPADDKAIADAENSGFKAGYAQAKAELASMLEAFPDRIQFALEQYNAGASVKDAKAALSDVLAAELSDANSKLTDAIAKAKVAAETASPAPVQLAQPTPATTEEDELRAKFSSDKAYELYKKNQHLVRSYVKTA
jgi:hypothetical protein